MRLHLRRTVVNILFIAVLLLIAMRFISIHTGTIFPIGVVETNSMLPTFGRGDIIIWTPVKAEDVQVGDIIVYRSYTTHERLVAHRVVRIFYIDTNPYFITKGDANPYVDQEGPFAPEPPISAGMLQGRVIAIGGWVLKVPVVGTIWFWLSDAGRILFGGLLAPAVSPYIGVPIVVGALAVIVAIALLWVPKKEAEELRLTTLIFGPEKFRVKEVFKYTFVAYIVILLSTFLFAYATIPVLLGVNQPVGYVAVGKLNYGYLTQGQSLNGTYFARNPGVLPLKFAVFVDGDAVRLAQPVEAVYSVGSFQVATKNVSIFIPPDMPNGTYNGTLFAYSSPFWMILPTGFMCALMKLHNTLAIITFDLLSAFLLSLFSIVVLYGVSKCIDRYITWRAYLDWKAAQRFAKCRYFLWKLFQRLKSVFRKLKYFVAKTFKFLRKLYWVEISIKKPIVAALFSLPFVLVCFTGFFMVAIFVSAFLVGVVAYIIGCRWRAQILLAVMIATAILFVSAFLLPALLTLAPEPVLATTAIIDVVAILLFLYGVFIIPLCCIGYLGAYVCFKIREKHDPTIALREDSDI